LVVCIGSTIGKTALTTRECATNQQINAIIPKDTDPKFLYFLMKYTEPEIRKSSGTQAVPLLNKSDFSKTTVAIPSLEEQTKIGLTLSSITRQIMSLRDSNTKRLGLKRSLMQDLLTGKVRVTVN
jgi:type I restriction enzyme, S subunit